ncbi:hypothetical protein ACIGHJ_21660, partial [Stutzerimonas kunmingensis]|uniref:hypothetical protein n=1 Tax=Stutzerimonas kunmingensis TaxID=1211807 RepID=UPI0037D72454
ASAKVICFMEKLGWRDRRISPDSGSLFQTFPRRRPHHSKIPNIRPSIGMPVQIGSKYSQSVAAHFNEVS